jgi:hypothetical protein
MYTAGKSLRTVRGALCLKKTYVAVGHEKGFI